MLQIADLGSVPAAFIFPRAFIAPFEEAAPLLCPSCGVPGSGDPPRRHREDAGRPAKVVRGDARLFVPVPTLSSFSWAARSVFRMQGRERCTSVP